MTGLLLALLAAAPVALDDDPVLTAMAEEVKRAMTLTMPVRPGEKPSPDKPYYANAFVTTEDTLTTGAEFGALYGPAGGHSISVSTSVRVGSPQLDNTNFQNDDALYDSREYGTLIEEDPSAIRRRLWLSFDADFKTAVESLAKKKAYLKANAVKEVIADFGPAPAEVVLGPQEPSQPLSVERYNGILKRVSAHCRVFPSPYSCLAVLMSRRYCQRMVASDGARHRFCEARHTMNIFIFAQAKDGAEVGWTWRAVAPTEAGLPTEAELILRIKEAGEQLEKKVAAPVAQEDYTGPVLFIGGQASGEFFLATVAAPLLKPRAAVGSLDQGQFAGRVDKHIGVKQLQVVDDPTQTQWKSPAGVSAPLIGAYPVDDEGVRPKRVSLVEDGVLKTLLMRRNPTPKVALTNGHARGSSTGPGNLFVASSTPLTLAQLKAKLLEVAQEEDLPYGLIVRQLSRTDRGSPSSVSLPSPMLVYRLYPDGHEELVRGLVFKPASFRVLKDIAGMGDDPALHNTEFVGQSVSVVAPSVLIRTLELVKSGDDSKPAVLPRPKLKP